MKPELVKILCCPDCKGDLELRSKKTTKGEVIEGILRCERCGIDYPIEDGIPNLLPQK